MSNHDGRVHGALGWVGLLWGVGGVVVLLSTAVARLFPLALELFGFDLGIAHIVAYGAGLVCMGWSEGYRGFQKAFSPRVVARAFVLARNPRLPWVLLAPAFCMGFFHATRKRVVVAWTLTSAIVGLVLLVRGVPQPWRGVIDLGVVAGLAWGLVALLGFFFLGLSGRRMPVDADLPAPVDARPHAPVAEARS